MKRIYNFFSKLEKYKLMKAIRDSLIMIIPVLMIGSFSLILKSFPIVFYQNFISEFAGGLLLNIFNLIYNVTFGVLSVYISVSLSFSYAKECNFSGNTIYYVSLTALIAFFSSVGILNDSFTLSSLGSVGMFTAVLSSICASMLFVYFYNHIKVEQIFSDGSDIAFNRSIKCIFPMLITIIIFVSANYIITTFLNANCFHDLFIYTANFIFGKMGRSFFSGFMFVLISSVLWFFGIHGSDVLEGVSVELFRPASEINIALAAAGEAPTEILTKTFFDVFVLLGGCGSSLCLLLAILLFSKRKSNRNIAKWSAFPMLFNINELMVFGLPIIFNPIMLIPFILTPITSYLISYAAMALSIVPLTINAIEWTTPIIIGGYMSVSSIGGILLQLINLAVGVFIYRPFVLMYDKEKGVSAKSKIDVLTNMLKKAESENINITLSTLANDCGDLAKLLINDLKNAIEKNSLILYYQPQFNNHNECIGAEALLRWNHEYFGMIYPPLIVKLADEAEILDELEKCIFNVAKSDIEKIMSEKEYDLSFENYKISINITAASLKTQTFIPFLKTFYAALPEKHPFICLEITEQTALLTNNDDIEDRLKELRDVGFMLAIDDFSMGYTSLKYLQNCYFNIVKLDGSLVRQLGENERVGNIVASIIYLSKSLEFSVLAEFVETEEQKNKLEKIGCMLYQGYLYSPAIARDKFIDLIKNEQKKQMKALDNITE